MANTLNLGDGNWATKEDSLLGYNSENNNYKPLPFDFTRASSATVVNKAGLIETVGNGEPRIDFKDNTKGSLLLEPTRTNSLLQSNQFDTTWTTTNAIITSGQIGVGGSSDAWLLSKSSIGGRINQSISLNGVQTTSIYAKADTSNWIAFISGGSKTAYFDLKNGVLGTISGTAIYAKIESVGNGWYRCSLTQDVTLTEIRVYVAEDDLDVNGTSGSIYIQNAQLEQGSYATSYIPTSGSAVTRSADVCNNGGNDQVINSTEGVLYFEGSVDERVMSSLGLSDGSGVYNNTIAILFNLDSINQITSIYRSNNITTLSTVPLPLNFNKIAIRYFSNTLELWLNGVMVGSETFTTQIASNVLNSLQFEKSNNTYHFYGNVKDVRVYNTSLTDAQLQALTQ